MVRRPIVWMIIPTYEPVVGGAQTQVRRVSTKLQECGWDVRILTRRHFPGSPTTLDPQCQVDGVTVHRTWSRGRKLGAITFIASGLARIFREGPGAIYHAHDIGTAGWLAVAARTLFGGAAVMKLRAGRYAYEGYVSSWPTRLQFQAQLRRVDVAHIVNKEVVPFLKALVPAGLSMRYVPNSVDVESFRPATHDEKRDARRKLRIDPSSRVYLFLGRIEFLKGLDVLLDAWRIFKEGDSQDAVLLVVGEGPDRDQAQSQANSCGDSVRFEGNQKNVRNYYAAADVFVLPSRTEGLSNSLAEAMASGLPVIASGVGGAPDILDNRPGERLFASADPVQLAQCLIESAENQFACAAGGERNRATALARLDLRTVAKDVDQLYRNLSRQSGRMTSAAQPIR